MPEAFDKIFTQLAEKLEQKADTHNLRPINPQTFQFCKKVINPNALILQNPIFLSADSFVCRKFPDEIAEIFTFQNQTNQ